MRHQSLLLHTATVQDDSSLRQRLLPASQSQAAFAGRKELAAGAHFCRVYATALHARATSLVFLPQSPFQHFAFAQREGKRCSKRDGKRWNERFRQFSHRRWRVSNVCCVVRVHYTEEMHKRKEAMSEWHLVSEREKTNPSARVKLAVQLLFLFPPCEREEGFAFLPLGHAYMQREIENAACLIIEKILRVQSEILVFKTSAHEKYVIVMSLMGERKKKKTRITIRK